MLAEILVGIVVAAAAALFGRMTVPRSVPVRTVVLMVGAASIGFGAALLFSLALGSGPSLTVYSSLPGHIAGGRPHKQASDIEKAIRLALSESDGKAGKFTVTYKRLDSTDETGALLRQRIQHNARIAASDDETAVYIGDLSSSASIESIPILSQAGVPQISPSSTRVGLTVDDDLVDIGEPDQYYPGGSRNFVRVIPNDDVQAAALIALMKRDRCASVAAIYDGQDYSQGLSVLMGLMRRPRRVFSEDVRPTERSTRYERLARIARAGGAQCFLYMGDDNANTFGIFDAFANALPHARLYGSDGVSEASLKDASGNLGRFARRVNLMMPPRDLTLGRYDGFRTRFANANNGDYPDHYAIYGYEAMRLALDAIRESGSGTRADIIQQLKNTKDRDSPLGPYSIDSNGDTSLADYDVVTFKGGEPTLRQAVGKNALNDVLKVIRARK